ncbi:hypothetical protein BDB01DRAFT_783190 [Pilobolus umbonatus]|nr:hypothetical protein BDB01DRAFT_783190 [Pilobolus umbonatus]
MKSAERVCCCLPVRLGVLFMSFTIFVRLKWISFTVILIHRALELEIWCMGDQTSDTPLTLEAFNGVFFSFSSAFILYALVSILGVASIIMQHRRLVRIYHVLNWFFVLLLLTTTAAFWIYFKVNQNAYINDCQAQQNINSGMTDHIYTPIKIPGKQTIAGGSDKSDCIKFVNRLVIGSGVCVFITNFIQIYWARSIGKYATSLKRYYQHQRIEVKDDESTSSKGGLERE